MNQDKIGKFIAKCRKEKKLTQEQLAEKLFVTDRAVSKWERGINLPDSSLMLDLCNILEINVNELLSGEKLDMKEYSKKAEENIIELQKQKEETDRHLLKLEYVIGYTSTITFLTLIFVASYIEMPIWTRILLIVIGCIIFAVGACNSIKIEQTAGYYECKNCNHKYVPKYSSVFFSSHIGRTRYLKCPRCGMRTWNKKVIKK